MVATWLQTVRLVHDLDAAEEAVVATAAAAAAAAAAREAALAKATVTAAAAAATGVRGSLSKTIAKDDRGGSVGPRRRGSLTGRRGSGSSRNGLSLRPATYEPSGLQRRWARDLP